MLLSGFALLEWNSQARRLQVAAYSFLPLSQDYPISDVHLILKKAKELQDSK